MAQEHDLSASADMDYAPRLIKEILISLQLEKKSQ